MKCDDFVKIQNKRLEKLSETKFLGVYIDSKLTWQQHISFTKRKISKGIGILSKAKKTLNIESLTTLYYSFVYPYFTYCLELWGNTCKTHMATLYNLQKKIFKIICTKQKKDSYETLIQKLELLPLKNLYEYRMLMVLFKFENNQIPCVLQHMFRRNNSVHNYDTRNANSFIVPRYNLELCKRSFTYSAIVLYNKAVKSINFHAKQKSFKQNIKKLLCTKPNFFD